MSKFVPEKCYAFDFECTTEEPAAVYLAAVSRLSDLSAEKAEIFYNIAAVVDYIFSRETGSVFYAHNLKYDISFIECYLFQKFPEEFTIQNAIIQELTKSVITLSITFRGVTIKFIDTVPIFSAPLKKVLHAYTDMEKGETPLYPTLEAVNLTQGDIDYCITDTVGLAKAIVKRYEVGKQSLTTASDAIKVLEEMTNLKSSGRFKRFYSPLPPDIDDLMRPAYRGGYTFLNPCYSGKVLEAVHVVDVNSMYPFQMYSKPLPYDKPRIVETGEVIPKKLYCLGIQKFTIGNAYIKDGYPPFLTNTNTLVHAAEYIYEITEHQPIERRTFHMTLEEFELFKEFYDYTDLQLCGGFLFKSRNDMFKEYIDHFWKLKTSDDPAIKTMGKLLLNSPYGKFSEGYKKKNFEIYYDEKICYREADTEIKPSGYLPVGIFITAYARVDLLKSIVKIGVDNFIYCDTDSMHIFRNRDNIEKLDMDKERIGAWDHENYFERAYYIRAKRYCGEYIEDGEKKLKIACAGIKTKDIEEQITCFEDFKQGREIKTVEFKQGVNGQYTRPKVIKI